MAEAIGRVAFVELVPCRLKPGSGLQECLSALSVITFRARSEPGRIARLARNSTSHERLGQTVFRLHNVLTGQGPDCIESIEANPCQ